MLLPLFVALFQTVADGQVPSRDARPVRVWLGSSGVLTRGAPVRVYVQAAQDGNLIVLHRRTDGRIEVLFPGKPNEDPFVRAGTYEIQATPSRVAFVVAEPDGSGLVLAALAPRDYRFDEFVRAAAWDPDALAPSWDGSDGEGVLSDIVQRMLGDGYFNYDIAAYAVAPPVSPIRAVPLGPGRSVLASSPARPAVPTRRRIGGASGEPASGRVVSLTLTPTRAQEETAEAPRSSGSLVLTGLTVSPPVQPAPRSRTAGSQRDVLAVQANAPAMARERGIAVAGSGSRAGGEAAAPATGRTQGIALPPAIFYGAQARVPATRTGVRRR